MQIKTVPEIITYTPGILDDINAYTFKTPARAARFLWKNKNHFIWNIMSCFEGITISLPDTETVLNGFAVENVSLRDLLKIRAYGRALESLCLDVRDNIFSPDRYALIELHKIAAREEIEDIELGHFRREDVRFRNVSWTPPKFIDLKYYWPQVERYIFDCENPVENGFVIFLALARIQFFTDVNKRTAMLFANGYLMSKCIAPFLIPNEEKINFSKLLASYYENGKADDILRFLGQTSTVVSDIDDLENSTTNKPLSPNF